MPAPATVRPTRSTSATSSRRGLGWLGLIGLAATLALVGCRVLPAEPTGAQAASLPSAASSGELVIVGGGLRSRNRPVHAAILAGEPERVVVVPTASGEPARSGGGMAADLWAFTLAPGVARPRVEVSPLEAGFPERAGEPGVVEQLAAADVLWFTGGSQTRILDVFRPGGVDSPAYGALLEVLARGGRVGGSSAGAAMMSDPMIRRGTSAAALTDGPQLTQGLGLFPFGLVDQHFLERGRYGRLAAALAELPDAGPRLGYGISEDGALVVDLAAGTGRALGPRAVVVLELRAGPDDQAAARAPQGSAGEPRRWLLWVSLAGTGDRLDLATGQLEPAADRRELPTPSIGLAGPTGALPTDVGAAEALPVTVAGGPFEPGVLGRMLEQLAREGTPQVAERTPLRVTVRWEAGTRAWGRGAPDPSAQPDLADLAIGGAELLIELRAPVSPAQSPR